MTIRYPYDLDGKLPARVHDPNMDLVNESPDRDWMPGDTCFLYHVKPRLIRFCVVDAVYQCDDGKRYSVLPIDDESDGAFSVTAEELFRTKEQILAAFFGKDPDRN